MNLVEIANGALDRVGQTTILSLDDQTISARKAKLHIYTSIRKVLRLGKWKSARKRAALAQSSPAPTFGWDYAYSLPTDFLRMVSVNDYDVGLANLGSNARPNYDINGKSLLTNDSVANIVYIADLTASGNDINVSDAALSELFILQLACDLCWPLQQSRTLRESMMGELAQVRRAALAADAQDTKDPVISPLYSSNWIPDRVWSTNG